MRRQIEQATPEDPEYEPGKAKAAIARFVSLHEYNLAQKAEVIVEHYRRKVRHRIGGMAKAMVVTASREHAARYKLALDKYVNDKGYTDIGVLVAFSGTLDLDGDTVSEASMNGFPDSQTAPSSSTSATTPRTSAPRSSPTTAPPWRRPPTPTCSTTPATPSTPTACCGPTRSSAASPCCWPREGSPTIASTPPSPRRSTGSGHLTTTSRTASATT